MLNLFRLFSSRREQLGLYRVTRTYFLCAGVAAHALAQSSQPTTEATGSGDKSSAAASERAIEAAA